MENTNKQETQAVAPSSLWRDAVKRFCKNKTAVVALIVLALMALAAIFAAAGPGIKQGVTTTRHLKQVDVAPTMAALLGTRVPAQCEGAPMYQIIDYKA